MYKVMDDSDRAVSQAIYNVLGIDKDGHKDILCIFLKAKALFLLSVLTDLQNRGIKDILIARIDNLRGFAIVISSVFPDTVVQQYVVHQIHNSCKYVGSKHQKELLKDLKNVYQ